jgi:hypothetical protein
MSFRHWARAAEQRLLRPVRDLARRLRRATGRPESRIARLERRVEELEELVRELTGLAYLRLDDSLAAGRPPAAAPGDREAA